jgi:hypothetical protein
VTTAVALPTPASPLPHRTDWQGVRDAIELFILERRADKKQPSTIRYYQMSIACPRCVHGSASSRQVIGAPPRVCVHAHSGVPAQRQTKDDAHAADDEDADQGDREYVGDHPGEGIGKPLAQLLGGFQVGPSTLDGNVDIP